jgi:adenosylcobinamide-GDP ribazoletransferase
MIIWRTLVLAFSVFSRIPMPRVAWTPANQRYLLAAFPVVGAVIGLTLWGWIWLCSFLGLGTLLFAAGLTLIPLAISGGIHLDGWCDTLDALASHADAAQKRAILKDPHTGAFAVIGLCAYLLATVALAAELARTSQTALLLGLLHILSRCISGLAVLIIPPHGDPGLGASFRQAADRRRSVALLSLIAVLCAAGLILAGRFAGGGMILAGLAVLVYLRRLARRQFAGMSGDLAGFGLQLAELLMLAVLVFLSKGGFL